MLERGWEGLTKRERRFVEDLEGVVQREKSYGLGSSEDCIRNHFHSFLKDSLVKIIEAVKGFKTFVADCDAYQKENKKRNRKSSKNFKDNEQGI